jgi:hypothetical protein
MTDDATAGDAGAGSDATGDASGHEAAHAYQHVHHGHVPVDPNETVVRARPPSPFALLLTTVAAALTVLALVALAVVTGQGS